MIKYVPHNEINKQKWDTCIANSDNEFIYAYSWYLDLVSPNWDALILKDYKMVMPLTWKKKWGIYYLYPPYFTKQLGIFSSLTPTDTTILDFIKSIPSKFKLVHIRLNEKNNTESIKAINTKINTNHEIDLSYPYNNLYKKYNRNCKRNIKKAENANLIVKENISPAKFVKFIKKHLDNQLLQLKKKDYDTLEKILTLSLTNGHGELLGIYDNPDELCAVGSFLITKRKCVFSVCASSCQGKKKQAMYFLVNHQVKKYAGSRKIFDFSGSDMKGIAYFNSTFGAKTSTHPTIIVNNLPWPLKFFKPLN